MQAKDFMPDAAVIDGIRKDIGVYEAERAVAEKRVRWRVPLFLGLLVAATFFVALLFNSVADRNEQWFSSPHVFLYFGAFVASFFVYSAGMRPATDLQQSFREKILPVIFSFISDIRYAKGRQPDSFDRLPSAAIGSYNRKSFDDVVSGRYEDFPFELYEVSLSQKSGKTESKVFKGVIVAFETITPFPGLLIASRKAGTVSRFFRDLFGKGGMEELLSGNALLDAAYDFRSDNVAAARPLVTGRLAQALEYLGETWPDDPARVALQGSDGFLLLPFNKNFFELPSIGTSLDYKEHVAPMMADMVSLLATASLVRKVGAPDDTQAQP